MADTMVRNWSDLPSDLLIRILGCMNARVYHLLLRAVCPAWRSALPLSGDGCPLLRRQLRFPSHLVSKIQERIFFLVSSPQNQLHKWVIHVEETEGNKWSFFNPLTGKKSYFPSRAKTEQVNLLDYQITELGRSHSSEIDDDVNARKEILVCLPSASCVLFRLSMEGSLLFFHSEFEKWVEFEPREAFREGPVFIKYFDDMILFKGWFYAVDRRGRLVKFNPLSLQGPILVVTCPLKIDSVIYPFDICVFLAESEGSLYLLVRHSVQPFNEKFLVFVLTEENGREAKWAQVSSIGDRVFFIGGNATFSVSSSAYLLNKANCIYFVLGARLGYDAGVYDLNTDELVRFNRSTDPDSHVRLFWPPPSWICDWEPDVDPLEWMFDWGPDVDPNEDPDDHIDADSYESD